MSNRAKLSSKFQISVPKEVRERQKWGAGQEFAFIERGKSCILVPVPTLDELRGIAAGADKTGYRDRNDRY